MSIEYDNKAENTLPGFRGEVDEVITFPTHIRNCNGDREKIVIEVRHTIKKGVNGGWSDRYMNNDKIIECKDLDSQKPASTPYKKVTGMMFS